MRSSRNAKKARVCSTRLQAPNVGTDTPTHILSSSDGSTTWRQIHMEDQNVPRRVRTSGSCREQHVENLHNSGFPVRSTSVRNLLPSKIAFSPCYHRNCKRQTVVRDRTNDTTESRWVILSRRSDKSSQYSKFFRRNLRYTL